MSKGDPILIVGGGLGGLTTALALARRGQPTRVLEGAPEFGAIGYGIQFGPNVFHVFDRLGLREEVLAIAVLPTALLMMDALTGKELIRVPTGTSFRARFKYPYIVVHRIDVHNVLLDACRRNGAIELISDAMVTAFEDRGDGITVNTADGRTFSGAALVAADGFRSLFRAALIGDGEPRPTGYVAFRTIVPMAQLKACRAIASRCGAGRASTSCTTRCATAPSSTLSLCSAPRLMRRKAMSGPIAPNLKTPIAMCTPRCAR
jgi:salicylate hydroxylase